jgi:rare lipoprotein A
VATIARLVPALILAVAVAGCATPRGSVQPPPASGERPGSVQPPPASGERPGSVQTGYASWYGKRHHGQLTTSGEVYDMNQFTAAHPTLPMGTRLRVTNLQNGRSVEVRVNDRGPAVHGRILDLSYAAARALGAVPEGVIPVRLRIAPRPP